MALAQDRLAALQCLAPSGRIPSAATLLTLRTRTHGLRARGATSPGGSCRLLAVRDGRLAVNLARADDWELLPAWLEAGDIENWDALATALFRRDSASLLARARLLGLAVAPVGPVPADSVPWCVEQQIGEATARPKTMPLVLDLSALWAGPLCAQLLRRCGARVIKVEHPARPDGARYGPTWFFAAMNGGKESRPLDLGRSVDRAGFQALLERADIIVEAMRPRVLRQFGFWAEDWLRKRPGRTWISITGYGREGPPAEWIAYGDDAGVAAGLSWQLHAKTGRWGFVGDAIADPLTGIHAALAGWRAHWSGGGRLLGLALRDVAAAAAQGAAA